jgi:hypothetical protein
MTDSPPDTVSAAPRRTVFARLAGGLVGGVTGLWSARALAAPAQTGGAAGGDWPGASSARHRLLVDAYQVNGGWPLVFAHTFLATNEPAGSAGVVLVLRAQALPIALESAVWAKYRIGEGLKIIDPETKAPAVKNPFLRPRPGALPADDAAVERLLAAGAVIGACGVALRGQSKALAGNAGVGAEEAAREQEASLVKGVTLLPSGVWGVGRAQEAGCGYCAGGG